MAMQKVCLEQSIFLLGLTSPYTIHSAPKYIKFIEKLVM